MASQRLTRQGWCRSADNQALHRSSRIQHELPAAHEHILVCPFYIICHERYLKQLPSNREGGHSQIVTPRAPPPKKAVQAKRTSARRRKGLKSLWLFPVLAFELHARFCLNGSSRAIGILLRSFPYLNIMAKGCFSPVIHYMLGGKLHVAALAFVPEKFTRCPTTCIAYIIEYTA